MTDQAKTSVTKSQKASGMTNASKRGKIKNNSSVTGVDPETSKKVRDIKEKQNRDVINKRKAKGSTFTTVDIATQHGINPKTLRARIRRNIDKWEPLFVDGVKHTFKDNVTTRKAIAALLDA